MAYIVMGGCCGDEHVIALYHSKKKAEKRAEKANAATKGLGAYVEQLNFADKSPKKD